MKSFFVSATIAALVASGCASAKRELVLDPVGPPSSEPASGDSRGALVVFSAFDVQPHPGILLLSKQHTDYKIFREDGQLLQTVHNDNGTSFEGPKHVELPSGTYRVVARANGYGLVTIPVVIEPNRTTTIHLEGGSFGTENDAVRLPDGQIVGWRIHSAKMVQH